MTNAALKKNLRNLENSLVCRSEKENEVFERKKIFQTVNMTFLANYFVGLLSLFVSFIKTNKSKKINNGNRTW